VDLRVGAVHGGGWGGYLSLFEVRGWVVGCSPLDGTMCFYELLMIPSRFA